MRPTEAAGIIAAVALVVFAIAVGVALAYLAATLPGLFRGLPL